MNTRTNRIVKSILFLTICFVLFIAIGFFVQYTYPFCSWLTGIDIGIWGYYVIGIYFLVSGYFLWSKYKKKSWTVSTSLWLVGFISLIGFEFLILNRYGENGRYSGDYIITYNVYDEDCHFGLADKWGKEIVWSEYGGLYRIHYNKTNEEAFVGVYYTDDDNYWMEIWDKQGKYLGDVNSFDNNLSAKNYIESNLGKVLEVYVDRDEAIFR